MLNEFISNYYDKLNTLTKYPSILTYHKMGKKGRLDDELSYPIRDDIQELYLTEKIDGTNSRIIISGNDYIIGSREELLHAKGDRIYNPTLGIVTNLKTIAERIVSTLNFDELGVMVIYGETYGGNIGKNRKNYSNDGNVGFRVFDVWEMNINDVLNLFNKTSQSDISSWRENGNQPFYSIEELSELSKFLQLHQAPQLSTMPYDIFPITINDTYNLLRNYTETKVGLDVHGKSEGIVVRNKDRSFIAKIRFADYERTLGIKNKRK